MTGSSVVWFLRILLLFSEFRAHSHSVEGVVSVLIIQSLTEGADLTFTFGPAGFPRIARPLDSVLVWHGQQLYVCGREGIGDSLVAESSLLTGLLHGPVALDL